MYEAGDEIHKKNFHYERRSESKFDKLVESWRWERHERFMKSVAAFSLRRRRWFNPPLQTWGIMLEVYINFALEDAVCRRRPRMRHLLRLLQTTLAIWAIVPCKSSVIALASISLEHFVTTKHLFLTLSHLITLYFSPQKLCLEFMKNVELLKSDTILYLSVWIKVV